MNVQPYLDLIFLEKQWSWTLLGIGYLITSLFIRSLFFRTLVRETKTADSNLYSAVRAAYLKNSVAGWIFFFMSFLSVIVAWLGGRTLLGEPHLIFFAGLVVTILFALSVALHLTAYARALLFVLKQKFGIEKEF